MVSCDLPADVASSGEVGKDASDQPSNTNRAAVADETGHDSGDTVLSADHERAANPTNQLCVRFSRPDERSDIADARGRSMVPGQERRYVLGDK